jgi:hypothetical protein
MPILAKDIEALDQAEATIGIGAALFMWTTTRECFIGPMAQMYEPIPFLSPCLFLCSLTLLRQYWRTSWSAIAQDYEATATKFNEIYPGL